MRSVTLFTLAITLLSSLLVEAGTCRVKDYGLPKCAKKCFKKAMNLTTACPTNRMDLGCICAQVGMQQQIGQCLDEGCSTAELAPAAQYGKDLCAAAAANATGQDLSFYDQYTNSSSAPVAPTAVTSDSAEGSMTILPVSESASASESAEPSVSASIPVEEAIAVSASEAPASSETSSHLAPPSVALAAAKDEPVVTITSNIGSQATGAGGIPNSQGGAGQLSIPSWIAVGLIAVTTYVAL